MAYGLKFTHNFFQIKNYQKDVPSTINPHEWQIQIHEEGYGGGVSTFDVDEGSINLSREGDLLEVIQGSKFTFSIINTSEGQFKEFRTANWGDYKVVLVKDPNGSTQTKFIGYNQSEIYTEEYNQPPYSSVLEFTCGLNHLQHIKWDDSGTLFEGQKSMIEVIRLALNKLPSPLPIREILNIYEDSINSGTTDSMLNQIYVDCSVYKKKTDEGSEALEEAFNCNETIEGNLKVFGINIYQANGIWYIIRVQEYMDDPMYFRDFNANVGTESTITIDGSGSFTSNERVVTGRTGADGELVLVAPDTELSIQPPLNRVQITYDQTNIDQESSNWVKNGCWNDKFISGGNYAPSFWDFTGSDPSTYPSLYYDNNNNGFQTWMMEFDPATQATAGAFDSGIYIEQINLGVHTSTLDSLLFSFKSYAAVGITGDGSPAAVINWINNSLEVVYEVEIKVGTYYLHGDDVVGFSWVNGVIGRASFKFTGGYAANGGSTATTFSYSTHWWRDLTQTLPTLPQSAFVDVRIRFYQPYTNAPSFADSSIDYTLGIHRISQTCFSIIYLPLEAAPTEELILNSVINEDENLEEIDVLHADGTNSGTLNSFRLLNGIITNEWTRRGEADDIDILTLFLQQLGDMRGDFVRELNGKLIGELDVFNTIEYTTDVLTSYYIKTYDWSIETSEYNVTLSELENSTLPVVIIKEPIPSPINPDPTEDSEKGEISSKASPISDGGIMSESTSINPNQSDLNNYI